MFLFSNLCTCNYSTINLKIRRESAINRLFKETERRHETLKHLLFLRKTSKDHFHNNALVRAYQA